MHLISTYKVWWITRLFYHSSFWCHWSKGLLVISDTIRHWLIAYLNQQLPYCSSARRWAILATLMRALTNHLLFWLQLASKSRIIQSCSMSIFLGLFSNITFSPSCHQLGEYPVTAGSVAIIYRSVKGFLPWILYVKKKKKSPTPYDGVVARGVDSNKVYPYQKLCPSTERFFTLDRESTACWSPFLIIQNSFLLKHPVGGFIAACKQAALNKIQSSFDESGLLFFESFPLHDVCMF